ncbi:MAG: hypothetical protein QOG19_3488 [Mycobacterium sp.]|jgi:hypothetical protein|nr:hypothetical protein [Mycobacterium sp.]
MKRPGSRARILAVLRPITLRSRVSGCFFVAFVEPVVFCGLGRLFGSFRGRLFRSGH